MKWGRVLLLFIPFSSTVITNSLQTNLQIQAVAGAITEPRALTAWLSQDITLQPQMWVRGHNKIQQ